VNLDNAASAPARRQVTDAVAELLPYYGSVHRGAGFASLVSTEAYTRARELVRQFVGAREDDLVLFTRNTTDAINLLAVATSSPTPTRVPAPRSEACSAARSPAGNRHVVRRAHYSHKFRSGFVI
jgi:selenocysteine lyase/cysteine desulfurase